MLSPRRAATATAAVALCWSGLALATPGAATAATAAPSPSSQTACGDATLTEHAKMARAVFVGTVEDVAAAEAPSGAPDGSQAFVASLAVERVYKPGGAMVVTTETVEVRTEQLPGRCSLGALEVGSTYLVFAGLTDNGLVATGESGTTTADASLVDDVEQLLGSGRPAVPPSAPVATFVAADTAEPVPFARAPVLSHDRAD